MQSILESNETCMFWTGVPKLAVLTFIFDWVLPCAKNTKLWMGNKKHQKESKQHKPKKRLLSLFEEFILTLVRLRRSFDTYEFGTLFGVSSSHVSHVFTTWVNLLYKCFLPLLEWPSVEIIHHNMPG